ncbi:Uncharacterised protein [Mycobacterium tuberculosis]|uniref:Uncharacterized protein n=1 Tax=Mycobacterium tuberculosis TaxID=1773 RepID=A0A655G6L9_MYCTX|nr:Uncharacterised protein [Mycobacterium tuberculosis]CFB92734.1 Uncharacterised protein [Mycobacterium tuberculosis]CFC64387.1 Uncharacterised protein [Mycobacterium tuberculosis]CFR36212.1 Uncharacterised protein [Mycobacterium tuberculosis]CFR79049.1 Uncharacterised protein [Mycobacterium tuberculosis]
MVGAAAGAVTGSAGAAGVIPGIGAFTPGMDGVSAGAAAAAGAAGVSPGKVAVIPGAAGAGSATLGALSGGVAPRAVARFCRICGALAAELISCCGMLGAGAGAGAGSA